MAMSPSVELDSAGSGAGSPSSASASRSHGDRTPRPGCRRRSSSVRSRSFTRGRYATSLPSTGMHRYDERTALVVVDLQNDFADPAGGLAVTGAEAIVPEVNAAIASALH